MELANGRPSLRQYFNAPQGALLFWEGSEVPADFAWGIRRDWPASQAAACRMWASLPLYAKTLRTRDQVSKDTQEPRTLWGFVYPGFVAFYLRAIEVPSFFSVRHKPDGVRAARAFKFFSNSTIQFSLDDFAANVCWVVLSRDHGRASCATIKIGV